MSLFRSFWKKGSKEAEKTSQPGKWQVGDKIANRYEIYQILGGEGKSGMGIVYICYDHEHKTPYALKTFQEKYLFSEEAQKLFEREALIWTKLERYLYIVRAHVVDRLEGRLFIVLEYIAPDAQGRNLLTHYLGNLTLPEILKFSIQFCYGMEYAYSQGIDAHRDIKPDNIMITPSKAVKITDFGLAKAFSEIQLKENIVSYDENPSLSIFNNKGKQVCGTLPYMAPEQFDGYADKRSDIYAFGITLYQMVTGGRFPFVANSQEEYERLHKYERPPQVSSPLFPIIQKCLEKDSNKRYQDFASLREELQGLLLKETGERINSPERAELKVFERPRGSVSDRLKIYYEAKNINSDEIQSNPGHYTSGWYEKGNILYNLGRYEEAISHYDEAIRLDPRYGNAWNDKGRALEKLGKFNEAIICYNELIRLYPEWGVPWYNKGVALYKLGRQEEGFICCGEALIWTELEKYPYIVRAYSVQRLEDRLFIGLEYIAPDKEGRNTLTHYLGGLSFPEILKFAIQFCYGMEYAYSKGVDAHRDIKPDNIMITSDKRVKITDFGLARVFQEIKLKEDAITSGENPSLSIFQSRGKRVCGTLPYMAPEQFDGYVDKRSDIYSFGIVLYQMVEEGKLPFMGRTQKEYEKLHRNAEVPPISSSLFPIIQKCLEKDPEQRFQDFTPLRKELQNLLSKETGETITLPKIDKLEAWELRNKGVALYNLGRYGEAITCHDEAIRINPEDAIAWYNKGYTLDDLGRYEEAITSYNEAIRINPRYAQARSNKGVTLKNLGRYEEALKCAEEAIRLNPDLSQAYQLKQLILEKLRRK